MNLRKLRFPIWGDKVPPNRWLLESNSVILWCLRPQVIPCHWHKATELFHELVTPSGSWLIWDLIASKAWRSLSYPLNLIAVIPLIGLGKLPASNKHMHHCRMVTLLIKKMVLPIPILTDKEKRTAIKNKTVIIVSNCTRRKCYWWLIDWILQFDRVNKGSQFIPLAW